MVAVLSKRRFFNGTLLAIAVALCWHAAAVAEFSRPLSASGPTEVEFAALLYDVDSVNGADQSFEANVFYRMIWQDRRLVDGESKTTSHALNAIWNPHVLLMNRQRIWTEFPEFAIVSPAGEVMVRQRVWGSFSQPLQFLNFPFDEQRFEIQFVAFGESPDELVFAVDPDSKIAPSFSLPDWTVTDWSVAPRAFAVGPEDETYPGVSLSFTAKRKYGYYIIATIFPLILVVAMSWVVFWMDPAEAGAQIGVSITAMLTLIALRLAVSAQIPKIDYLTRIDLFILSSTIFVFATLIQVLITSQLASKGSLRAARRIDLWCRIVFPAGFTLLTLETLVFDSIRSL